MTVNHIYQRVLPNKTEAHYLLASRLLMVVWGLLFFAAAMFFSRYQGVGLLELTFKLPNYFYGALAHCFARYGIGRFSTIILGVPATQSVLIGELTSHSLLRPVSGLLMVATVALHGRRWDARRRKRLTATLPYWPRRCSRLVFVHDGFFLRRITPF